MTIVMGLDQHRAQITAEWIDTETGEVSRARVMPAHRGPCDGSLSGSAVEGLEVALEATTGWRFVVEELRRVGAVVHLAEPAETARCAGKKKRAKTDRADARHLRELLLVGRLPESWIPPEHILDLRARVRLRHYALDAARRSGSSGCTRCSITTGARSARDLLTRESRDWLAGCRCRPRRVNRSHRPWDDRRARHPARAVRPRAARATRADRPGCKALMGRSTGSAS